MIPIKAYSVGDAHKQVVLAILQKGSKVVTQDKELTLELLDVVIEITTPTAEPRVHKGSNFQKGKLVEYVSGLLYGTKGEFTYDYHSRIFEWGKGEELGFLMNQFESIKVYLKKEENRDSRRAVIITWYPWKDLTISGPCLQFIQFIIRNDKLHMSVLFRSNDMLSALGANMYALTEFQRMMASCLDVKMGGYTHHSVSAHVYVTRDQHELENMLMAEWDRPREDVNLWLRNEVTGIPWK